LDINADFDIGSAKAFGFKTWGTDIRYDVEARHLECFGKAAKLEPVWLTPESREGIAR